MSRREVRAGQAISLRARFRDDLEDPAQATSVYIHLYEPDTTVFDLSNAYTVSGVPTYLGEGIFEYEFTVPDTGPDGDWWDEWHGSLTGQDLTSRFSFEVSASGVITELPAQIYPNNIVQVTIAKEVEATDGSTLDEDYEFEFMTTITPAYTNVRKVRLEIGGFIAALEDDVVQQSILEGSLEADVLSFTSTGSIINNSLYTHARREYVTCLVSTMLLHNLGTYMLQAKSLDNLSVKYDTSGMQKMLSRLIDCLDKWEPQLLSGGGAKAIRSPQYLVKGDLDPDRPNVSRMWQSTEWGSISRRMPLANDARKPTNHRRFLKTHRKKYW